MGQAIGSKNTPHQFTIEDMQKLAKKWQQSIKSEILDVMQAEFYLDLTGGNGADADATAVLETSGMNVFIEIFHKRMIILLS